MCLTVGLADLLEQVTPMEEYVPLSRVVNPASSTRGSPIEPGRVRELRGECMGEIGRVWENGEDLRAKPVPAQPVLDGRNF